MNIPALPRVRSDIAVVAGGMDVVVSPLLAKPGLARMAYNYEYSPNGGVERVGGFEPFDGHPSPSKATYSYLLCDAIDPGVTYGDTLVGVTSTATGVVCYVSGKYLAVTKVSGVFTTEVLKKGGSPIGTVTSTSETVDGTLDNQITKAASDLYQADIAKVPGSGQIRGIAVLNDHVYAWRDNNLATAMVIWKATAAGWTAVPLYYELAFTAGTAAYTEGGNVVQGGVSAVVKRVVLESGNWSTNDAAGRLIIEAPTGGNFAAAAIAGGGAATASGIQTQITLLAGGRVRWRAHNFTAAIQTQRLYGCDGVNREFEFGDDILVPLNTGMGAIRAVAVECHKNYVFFAYRGSVQHSAVGFPYQWSALMGAGELGVGDQITCLQSVGGSVSAAALFIACRNSLHVLYGDSTQNWNLQPLSHVSGAQADTVADIGGVVALDSPGVVRYPYTRDFGNFAWDTMSMSIQPIARGRNSPCAVYAPKAFKYRVFFDDGSCISGLPIGVKSFWWSIIDYGVKVVIAEQAEINGEPRVFYGGLDGWVYEADVGRSFAGRPIVSFLKLHPLSQRMPMIEKAYRQTQIEVTAKSATVLQTAAEFYDDAGPSVQIDLSQPGLGMVWGMTSWGESYWGTGDKARKIVPTEGIGNSIEVIVGSNADNELPHSVYAVAPLYTPRKISR